MNYQEIEGKHCTITLEARPGYCDRGRYIAKVFLKPSTKYELHIDTQDGWPRYYFSEDNAKSEVEAWLRFRNEWVNKTWETRTA